MDQIWKASLKFYLFKIIFLSIIWDPGLSHVPGCFSICNPGDSSSVLETAMKTATDLWTCFSLFFSFLGYLSAVQVTKIFSCPLTYFNFPLFFFLPPTISLLLHHCHERILRYVLLLGWLGMIGLCALTVNK